jgi:glycosyltransferase involved in cell wall biosynthesis
MLTVVYCTRETNPQHKEHLIKSSGLHKHIEVIEIINNGESLTKAYNRGLKQATNDIVVFCHDDIIIETKQWGDKLLKQFKRHDEYGIIGVAGTKFMPSSGQWWEQRKKMYGRVAHTNEGKSWLSTYSPDMGHDIEETVVVDGVFFAVDKTKLKTNFDEKFEGFHFYDISFCFENHLEGVKIGVITAIRINHKSIGMTNESWEANRLQFAETFKGNLPVEIKKVIRKGQKLKVLVGCLNFKGESNEEKYIHNLLKKLTSENCDVTLISTVDKKYTSIVKQLGVKVASIQEPPSFKLGDGQWLLKTPQGDVVSQANTLYKVGEADFDLIYLSQKAVVDHVSRLFPDTDIINIINTMERGLDEPLISPQVIKYIAVSNEVSEMLIDGYNIDASLVEIVKPVIETEVKKKLKKGPIKIATGWSDRGGSTNAFIALTNALNAAGYDATLYGPHSWHLDKCKSGMLDKLNVNPSDRLITHFMQLPNRPNAGKVLLSCHEKNMFEVGDVTQFWDEVVFINQRHKDYHNRYHGKYTIIPNLKASFIHRDKTGLEKIAGVIGSFDDNKQTHISIQRALADGMDLVYLFGDPIGPYYETYVKPLLSEKVIVKGFTNDKQAMYDMLSCVYHSSKSEVACLVKDECETTGVDFRGTESTNNPPVLLTNEEILSEWLKILEL